jgi:hypothetical protein
MLRPCRERGCPSDDLPHTLNLGTESEKEEIPTDVNEVCHDQGVVALSFEHAYRAAKAVSDVEGTIR